MVPSNLWNLLGIYGMKLTFSPPENGCLEDFFVFFWVVKRPIFRGQTCWIRFRVPRVSIGWQPGSQGPPQESMDLGLPFCFEGFGFGVLRLRRLTSLGSPSPKTVFFKIPMLGQCPKGFANKHGFVCQGGNLSPGNLMFFSHVIL